MHGFVEAGTCRNDPCGQYGARQEDGYCSHDCRVQATRCSVPCCGCGGACELDADQGR
jgi:A20-like zinc finger